MNLEGIQYVDSHYWDEGQNNGSPPCSSSWGGRRHGRTTRSVVPVVLLPSYLDGAPSQRAVR